MGISQILQGRLPETCVPRQWREITSEKFSKLKLTVNQQDRVNRMTAWSLEHLKAKSKEANLGFLLHLAFLQKYLGFTEHRRAGMDKVLDVLFEPEKKGKVGGTYKMRSRNTGPIPFEETEASASSTKKAEGGASLTSSREESLEGGQASPIAEGLIILDDSSAEDGVKSPLRGGLKWSKGRPQKGRRIGILLQSLIRMNRKDLSSRGFFRRTPCKVWLGALW